MTSPKQILRCRIAHRREGDYAAECLELGIVVIEDSPGEAKAMLEDGMETYLEAARHFAAEGKPVKPRRPPHYGLKRLWWECLHTLKRPYVWRTLA